MGYEHRLWRLLLGVFAALTGVAGSGVRQLAVAAAVVAGVEGSGQEPLGCWICTSQSHGPDCYHPLNQTSSFTAAATKNCTHDQLFCTVKRTWYVVEGGDEEIEFSMNRTCAKECSPYCMVIGDRTKWENT